MKYQSQEKRQTTPYTLGQYAAAGCWQLRRDKDGMPDAIGIGIHAVTGGMMCNGCPEMRNRCASFAKLEGAAAGPRQEARQQAAPAETVRQEAQRRGISINQVRRERAK